MRIYFWPFICFFFLFFILSCKSKYSRNSVNGSSLSENTAARNLERAMVLADNVFLAHFDEDGASMSRYYNPFTDIRSDEIGSVWMYTSAIEAVNAILHALMIEKELASGLLYDAHFDRYVKQLKMLYENVEYYRGKFILTSYTQTTEWSVYGVHRGTTKGGARVDEIENVYDDQMWLVRELLESYMLTADNQYLEKAEYLTQYVLDGWDCTLDDQGNEYGGIPWGPGYVTKHACSNGPMISPLVWLHSIYKDTDDVILHRYIDPEDKRTRSAQQMNKCDYYLMFAKKIYAWQKNHLIQEEGVYSDMMGGCVVEKPELDTIDGVLFRRGGACKDRVGRPYSYNSGTMLSGAADLYEVTNADEYLLDGKNLAEASFNYFAKKGLDLEAYYSYDTDGFNNWFNGVLLRGYVDLYPVDENVDYYINTFQQNLDYGYENHCYNGVLPTDLRLGWNSDHNDRNTEGMFGFSFAAEYALLARYHLSK